MQIHFWEILVVVCLLCPQPAGQALAAINLHQLAASAGYIFAGTVMAIERAPAVGPNEVETIRVTFRVDEGVRGVRSRQVLTIREWAGLWTAGERYRPGEHVVLMLYPPSHVGLTSPVGGAMGTFPLDRDGNLTAMGGQSETLAHDPVVGPWLRGRSHASGRDFVRVLRRGAEE